MVRFRHFRSTYGAFQPLPRLLEASKRFSLRVGGSTSHRLPGSSGPVAVYRLSSLEAKAGASNLVPRFKKADSQTPVQDGEGAFSLECYDAALQNGEVDVCWEQILSLKNSLEGATSSSLHLMSSENLSSVDPEANTRSMDQLVADQPGPGPSSLQQQTNSLSDVAKGYQSQHPELVTGLQSEGENLSSVSKEVGTLEDLEPVSTAEEQQGTEEEHAMWRKIILKNALIGRHKKFIKECISRSRRDLLVQYIRLLPAEERVFSWLAKECLQAKDCDAVLQILELRKELGMKPDKYSYSALISALVRKGDIKGARNAFDTAVQGGIRSIYIYNGMLDGYGRVGDLTNAMEIWDKLCQNGLRPDSYTYTGLIRVMGNTNRMDDVRRVLEEMVDSKVQPTPHTFTIIFDAAAESGEQDSEWLFSLSKVMVENGISMNNHTLSAMVTAVSHIKLESCDVDRVFNMVQEFRRIVGTPSPIVYSSLLQFCGRQGVHERVIDVWNAMQEDEVEPNCHVYSAAFKTSSLVSSKDPVIFWFVEHVGNHLEEKWRSRKNYDRTSMLIAFNSFINAWTSLGDVDRAMAVYASMCEHGPTPDEITYNTLLAGFASKGRLSSALKVMDNMRAAHMQLCAFTYVALLTACAKAQEADIAWSLFQEMIESGVEASVEAYTALMDACVKEGSSKKLNQAFDLLEAMEQEGLKPTAVTYGCLLVACWQSGNVDRAFDLYREAHENGILPTDSCHNILINLCTRSGRLEEALTLVKDLARRHGSIEHYTLNSLTRALARDNINRAVAVLRLMRLRKMEPTKETYHSLILACVRSMWSKMALDLYKQMRGKGIKGSREVGSAVIESLCSANDIKTALRITADMLQSASLPMKDGEFTLENSTGAGETSLSDGRIGDCSQLPDILALGELCSGLVRIDQLEKAMKIFRMARSLEGDAAMRWLATNMGTTYEALIELSCRRSRIELALEVFDTWKEAAAMVMAQNRSDKGEEWAYKRHPHLSQASLAFLLSTCRKDPELDWRVHDVCASMRQQREWQHEALLPRPNPENYHIYEGGDGEEEQVA